MAGSFAMHPGSLLPFLRRKMRVAIESAARAGSLAREVAGTGSAKGGKASDASAHIGPEAASRQARKLCEVRVAWLHALFELLQGILFVHGTCVTVQETHRTTCSFTQG